MAPLKRYRTKRLVTFNAELDMFNEFEEICYREKKTTTEKLNEFIVQTVERNGIGENNPLGITYSPSVQQKITSFNIDNPIEVLDWCLDNGIIGLKQWQPALAEVHDQERMDRYLNLTETMSIAAKNRRTFLKTGKAAITAGKVQTLSMQGTRIGF